ncbi:MAG: 5-formyltetrahydrofolate cyclo-ligase [Sphingobacteriaceae bacterium]
MNKSSARKLFLSKRHSLSEHELEAINCALLAHFKPLDLSSVQFLHLFLPIRAKKEVNTYPIAEWIRQNYPEIKLVLSRSNFEDHSLTHLIWNEQTVLTENAWGITEPQNGEAVSAQKLDLILVPLLVFDETGQRIGYGKGFYDRFLAACRPDAQKIGLSHFEPIVQIEDTNSFDIRLDACISPKKIWKF